MQSSNAALVSAPSARISRFDRYAMQRAPLRVVDASPHATASAIKAQRSARIDVLAIVLALAAAALVRFNVVPGIGW